MPPSVAAGRWEIPGCPVLADFARAGHFASQRFTKRNRVAGAPPFRCPILSEPERRAKGGDVPSPQPKCRTPRPRRFCQGGSAVHPEGSSARVSGRQTPAPGASLGNLVIEKAQAPAGGGRKGPQTAKPAPAHTWDSTTLAPRQWPKFIAPPGAPSYAFFWRRVGMLTFLFLNCHPVGSPGMRRASTSTSRTPTWRIPGNRTPLLNRYPILNETKGGGIAPDSPGCRWPTFSAVR